MDGDKVMRMIHESVDSITTASDAISYQKSLQDTHNRLNDEIRSFFTGKEAEVHQIYDGIINHKFPYNKVCVTDVNVGIHTYKDYVEGMKEYIDKLFQLSDNSGIDPALITKKTTEIYTRDKGFNDGLFKGDRNPCVEVDIDTAMKNVEAITELDDIFKELEDYGTEIVNHSTGLNGKYKDTVNECISLFYRSACQFSVNLVSNIINTYKAITSSISKRESSPVGKQEVPKYQIF